MSHSCQKRVKAAWILLAKWLKQILLVSVRARHVALVMPDQYQRLSVVLLQPINHTNQRVQASRKQGYCLATRRGKNSTLSSLPSLPLRANEVVLPRGEREPPNVTSQERQATFK